MTEALQDKVVNVVGTATALPDEKQALQNEATRTKASVFKRLSNGLEEVAYEVDLILKGWVLKTFRDHDPERKGLIDRGKLLKVIMTLGQKGPGCATALTNGEQACLASLADRCRDGVGNGGMVKYELFVNCMFLSSSVAPAERHSSMSTEHSNLKIELPALCRVASNLLTTNKVIDKDPMDMSPPELCRVAVHQLSTAAKDGTLAAHLQDRKDRKRSLSEVKRDVAQSLLEALGKVDKPIESVIDTLQSPTVAGSALAAVKGMRAGAA